MCQKTKRQVNVFSIYVYFPPPIASLRKHRRGKRCKDSNLINRTKIYSAIFSETTFFITRETNKNTTLSHQRPIPLHQRISIDARGMNDAVFPFVSLIFLEEFRMTTQSDQFYQVDIFVNPNQEKITLNMALHIPFIVTG